METAKSSIRPEGPAGVLGFLVAGLLLAGFNPADAAEGQGAPAAVGEKGFSTLKFEFEVFAAELDKPLRALGRQYIARLAKLEAELSEEGKTADAEILRKEIATFEKGGVEIPRPLTEARRLRRIYEREALPLIRARNRKSVPLFEKYRGDLVSLHASLIGKGNEGDAERVKAELATLEQLRTRWVAAGIPGGRPDAGPKPYFEDDFSESSFGRKWAIREANPVVADGRVRAVEIGSEIAVPLGFDPADGFRVEFDLEKQGENHHSGWDFEVLVGDLKGTLLFDSGEEDRLAVTRHEDVSRDGVNAGLANAGTAVLTCGDGKARFRFTNSQGRSMRSDWIPVTFEKDKEFSVRFRLAGGGEDSPRLIDNVKIYRGSGDSERGLLSVR